MHAGDFKPRDWATARAATAENWRLHVVAISRGCMTNGLRCPAADAFIISRGLSNSN